jgi:hypothetical protein
MCPRPVPTAHATPYTIGRPTTSQRTGARPGTAALRSPCRPARPARATHCSHRNARSTATCCAARDVVHRRPHMCAQPHTARLLKWLAGVPARRPSPEPSAPDAMRPSWHAQHAAPDIASTRAPSSSGHARDVVPRIAGPPLPRAVRKVRVVRACGRAGGAAAWPARMAAVHAHEWLQHLRVCETVWAGGRKEWASRGA